MRPASPEPHPCELTAQQLMEQCRMQATRRSGPGGQHRNKVESAIVLTHLPTQIIGQASERRSQHENRKVALRRLRINLAVAVRTERTTVPSQRWNEHLAGKQILISPGHQDFPALLAEALDVVARHDFSLSPAAKQLGCTTSQLVKLLQLEPSSLVWLNRQRQERGLRKIS